MNTSRSFYHRLTAMPVFSPGGLAARAVFILAFYLLAHLAGLRECTSILSGTTPQGTYPATVEQIFAVTYIMAYLGAVMLAPILLIAAVMIKLLGRLREFASR
jgi:hypothetical protein